MSPPPVKLSQIAYQFLSYGPNGFVRVTFDHKIEMCSYLISGGRLHRVWRNALEVFRTYCVGENGTGHILASNSLKTWQSVARLSVSENGRQDQAKRIENVPESQLTLGLTFTGERCYCHCDQGVEQDMQSQIIGGEQNRARKRFTVTSGPNIKQQLLNRV